MAWTYVRPWMYPKQLGAIFSMQRYALIEASTKTGKTVGCIVWLFEQAIQGNDGDNYWWVAPWHGTAKIAFRRMKRYVPKHLYKANESELTLTLVNGATVWFKSGEKPDALYGEDVRAAVLDEATRMREEAWHAVRSTLTATRGPIRIIGNVKGRKNWAYLLARRAQSGEKSMSYAKLTAYDAAEVANPNTGLPVLAVEEIEDAKRTLPDRVFRELYLAEPSDDGNNPFGLDAIRACVERQRLGKPGAVVAYGGDLAKSIDWTVLIGLDAAGLVSDHARWQRPWRQTIRRIVRRVGATPTLLDSTGVGDPVLEEVQARCDDGNVIGFKFSPSSKQQLMEGLAVALQHGDIGVLDGVMANELEAFEFVYTRTGVRYSAPEGMHDDEVCALALADRHRRHGVLQPLEVFSAGDPARQAARDERSKTFTGPPAPTEVQRSLAVKGHWFPGG